MSAVGVRARAIDWDARTSGRTRYAADLKFEGLLVGRILRSPHAHALIRSTELEEARRMPGVHAAVDFRSFPAGARYQHEGARDRPPLADGIVRFIGQEVAAVAAETVEQAEAALREIRVDYAPLPAPLTPRDALAAGAPHLHERKEKQGNVSRLVRRLWGDAARGRAAAQHRVSGAFAYPRVTHACMEPSTTVARWDAAEAKMHLWTSTQAPYFIVREVAQVLGVATTQVVCHEVAVGGGFGAKSKICEHEVIAAVLAMTSGRPVLVSLSREEEFAATKTRHAFSMQLQLHADTEGGLRAIDGEVLVDNGAYDHSGVSVTSASLKAFGMMYRPDGIEVGARLVDTATQPGGQFRGYGSTQTGFALECLMDELAECSGSDPIDLRIRNANQPGDRTLVGASIESVRLTACLEAVREAVGWREERARKRPGRGLGVAAGVHPSGVYTHDGGNRSDCAIDVFTNGRVRLRFGGADAGTGQKTILAQIASHELGVDLGSIEVLTMDSERTPHDLGAFSSRGTHYGGHAARLAASQAAGRIKAMAAEVLGSAEVQLEGGFACAAEERVPIGSLVAESPDMRDGIWTVECSYVEPRVEKGDPKTGVGNYSASYNFAAHAAVVDVERRTGRVRVVDYVAAHDSGVAINPTFVEGQIAGGVAMGLGGALGEELVYEQGKLANPAYLHYALPRAADLPRIRPILVEGPDPNGPYGAKGVGELGVNPPGPAIANAVYDAIGIRIRELPITPDKVLDALAEKEGRRRAHRLWRRPGRWWIQLVRWAYPRGLLRLLHRAQEPLPAMQMSHASARIEAPLTLDEAARAAASGDAVVLAGGTDVQLQRRQGLIAPARLISVLDVRGMTDIDVAPGGAIRLGAAATLVKTAAALKDAMPALSEAIESIATPQIRAMATVGGNLLQAKRCWFYRNDFPCYKRRGGLAPCYAVTGDHRFYHAVIDGHRCQAVTPSDLATVLVAFDAYAVLAGANSRRVVPVARLYRGPGESILHPGELLTEILIAAPAVRRRAVFEKLNLWEGDFALAAAALSADVDETGRWRDVRIVFGGVAPTPWRARRTEKALEGTVPTAATLRAALDRELDAAAHPLARNGWKLDAAAGLAERLAERIQQYPDSDPGG